MYISEPLCKSGAQKRASDPMKLELKAVVLWIPGAVFADSCEQSCGCWESNLKTNQCSESLGPLSSPHPWSFKEHQTFNPGTWETEAVKSLREVKGRKRGKEKEEKKTENSVRRRW